MATRLAAVALTVPLMFATGFGVLVCLYLRLLGCDESCDMSERWWYDPGAWQRNLFLVLAALGSVSAFVLVAAVANAALGPAAAALATWTASAVALVELLHQLGHRKRAATGWYGIALVVLLAVISIAVAGGRPSRQAQTSADV